MTDEQTSHGLSLVKLRRQFTDYATAKVNEIEEFRMAERYHAGVQYTKEERRKLSRRKQPPITFNRIGRKIDGNVGTIRRLRTDPKAYARTEGQDDAAELATQVVRYICDSSEFERVEASAALQSAVIGYAFAELGITGPSDNPDIEIMGGDSKTFFYDPRSTKPDFSDARFMGTYRWATVDELEELFPGSEDLPIGDDYSISTQADEDREDKWVDEKGRRRLVDHWYIYRGRWMYCIHVGSTILASGESPFIDDNGRSFCKFIAFSAYVDHEGDRYGMVRNMKGPQDAINQHRSKAMWIMNARQIIVRKGAVADIEKLRAEAMKPDGIIEYEGSPDEIKIEQPNQEFLQQTQYFQDAKQEIENFGPNPALLGNSVNSASGRAISIMQQAGLAELGPYLANFRQWKLSIYKAAWSTAKRYWKAERWLRITGQEDVAQFVKVNELQLDEFGEPYLVNNLGAIDVDITMSEGPDTENVMGDVFDTLQSLAQNGATVPPEVIIEMSPLPSSVKEKLIAKLKPPAEAEQAVQMKVEQEQAKTKKTEAEAFKAFTDGLLNQQQLSGGAVGAYQGNDAGYQGEQYQEPMRETPSAPQPQMPTQQAPGVTISLNADQAMGEAAQALTGMAEQNNEFIARASEGIMQSSDAVARAMEMMVVAADRMAAASERVAAPKKVVRDPKTNRVVGIEVG